MSNSALKLHDRLLRENGFVEIRHTKHRIFRNPEGKVYVCASTPSDWRAGHRMLTSLKHVIASPAKPMVIAIADYEREAAAAVIAAQPRAVQGIGGGASRGRGTGFIYDDKKVLTIEQIAQREQLRQRARANKEARRAAKLARMAERAAEQEARIQQWRAQEAEREKRLAHLRPFIDLMKYSTAKFHELSIARWKHYPRAWDAQSNYVEYPFRNLEELRFALDYRDLRGRSVAKMDEVVTLAHDASFEFQPPSLKKLLESVEELVVEYNGSLSDIADQISDRAAKLENDESQDGLRAFFAREVHELILTLLESLEGSLENFAHDMNIVEPDSDDFFIRASGNCFVVTNANDGERTGALEFPPQNLLDQHIHFALLVKTLGDKEINVYHGGFPLTDIPEFAAAVVADDEEETEQVA